MDKHCENCKYHDDFTCVCFNGDSLHRADFTDNDWCCDAWEGCVDGQKMAKE